MFPENSEPVNQTVDEETCEVVTWEHVTPKHGPRYHREVYSQDNADLLRWAAQGSARRLLFATEEKIKRKRIPFYTEVAPYTDIRTRLLRWCNLGLRHKVRVSTHETFDEDGNVIGEVVDKKRVPKFRVMDCCRSRLSAENPEIWYSKKSERASYHKVGVCGSVWTCPICSRRINLSKQELIKSAYDLMIDKQQGDALMITFTIKHGSGDDLADLFSKLKSADEVMQVSYSYKEITRKTARKRGGGSFAHLRHIGRISATEITYGNANGWHPHMHQLWFFDRKLTPYEIKRIRRQLWLEWEKACIAVGLPAPKERAPDGRYLGVDVRRALSAAEYMAKFGTERQWAPEKEIASQHVKVAKKGGKSPFQLLDEYGRGDKRAGALFVKFAHATLGRHQLEFSKRLMKYLKDAGIEDVGASDEELAARHDDESLLLGELSDGDFIALRDAEKFGIEAYGTALFLAKTKGFDASVKWLRSLPSYPSVSSVHQNVYVLQRVRDLRDKYEILREQYPEAIRVSFLDDDVSILQYEHDPRQLLHEWIRIVETAVSLIS